MMRSVLLLFVLLLTSISCKKNTNQSSTAEGPCSISGPLPFALLNCRNWITFAPPRPFDPSLGIPATESLITSSLEKLYAEGWRGLVTYSLDPSQGLHDVPRIAKQVGFTRVVAGLFWFDAQQLGREWAVAIRETSHIDAYVLGNEGLQFNRYTRSDLEREIARLRSATRRHVTTTEPLNQYQADSTLLFVGDWVFPNLHPYHNGIRNVPAAVEFTRMNAQWLEARAPGRTIVLKECWWPTAGHSSASEGNQVEFFKLLSVSSVKFIWGEAYDQYWKTAEGPQGPHWGLHTDRRTSKTIITSLKSTYTGSY